METYKLGNKINCIIRAYSTGNIGSTSIEWANQPYSILKDVGATINFADKDRNSSQGVRNLLAYNTSEIDSLNISNVLLTDKVLNLLFDNSEEKLCTTTKDVFSTSDGKIYLTCPQDTIYNVFIFNEEGLELALDTYNIAEDSIHVDKNNSPYLVIYSYEGNKAVSFSSPRNLYLTLDLELTGNVNDETSKMWIHLDKCAVSANKTLYFNQDINTVDLDFKVLSTDKNYIVLS